MSARTTSSSLTGAHGRHRPTVQPSVSVISKHKADQCSFPTGIQRFRHLTAGRMVPSENRSKKNFVIYGASGEQPEDLIPFANFLHSWKSWIPGILITIVIPLFTKKWGPFANKVKAEVDQAEEIVDNIADVVEEVAENVQKIAEDIAEELPEGGKIKNILTKVDNVAKEIDKDAQAVEDMVKKVEQVEKKVESIVEEVTEEKANESAKAE